ncbi:MAG: ATP-binding domain-containing protein, partial [Chloroflexi bacterium]|nr:ATP-binding domain-containing protein [Chloroflexota bacterium]
ELARHLLIDEFRDTSFARHRRVSLLGGLQRNVFAVGSPTQGIYGWRGADPTKMVSLFTEAFPDARVLALEQHYRSTQTILDASRAIGNGHADTQLWTDNPAGALITVARLADEVEEAKFVADMILELRETEGVSWSDFAILFRVRRQVTPLEQHFIQHSIPYQVTAGNAFFQRRDVRQLIAYLRLAHDPFDGRSLGIILNVPPRGIGPVTRRKLLGDEMCLRMSMISEANNKGRQDLRPQARAGLKWLADFLQNQLPSKVAELTPRELLAFIIRETRYDRMLDDALDAHRRWANVCDLQTMAGRHETLEKLLGKLNELEDETLESAHGVVLSTIHAAKGLEFRVVFVIGMEDGLLPLGKKGGRSAEERRVFYVAMTRARERLFLTHVRTRRDYLGRGIKSAPSPFLRELPRELTERKRYG